MRKTVRIGDLMVYEGLITNDQLFHIIKLQKEYEYSRKYGEILSNEG